jgi:hypothetical protein
MTEEGVCEFFFSDAGELVDQASLTMGGISEH